MINANAEHAIHWTHCSAVYSVLVVFLGFWGSTSWALNGHDHLYSLPSAADFTVHYRQIFSLKKRSQSLQRLLGSQENLRFILISVFGLAEDDALPFLEKPLNQSTLFDLCLFLNKKEPQRALLSMLEANRKNTYSSYGPGLLENSTKHYIIVENIRRALLLSLDTETFLSIFSEFLRTGYNLQTQIKLLKVSGIPEHLHQLNTIDVSVPKQFFDKNQRQKLFLLRMLGSFSKKATFRFLVSIPRRSLLKDKRSSYDAGYLGETHNDEIMQLASFNSTILDDVYSTMQAEALSEGQGQALSMWNYDFRDSFREPLVSGFDITGSIRETQNLGFDATVNDVEKLLSELISYCTQHKVFLRLHAFERSNRGPFYDGLFSALKKTDQRSSKIVRIGHAVELSEKWLYLLASKKIPVELNIISNMFLQGIVKDYSSSHTFYKKYRKILKFNDRLKAEGEPGTIPFLIGFDGQGLLGTTLHDQIGVLYKILKIKLGACEGIADGLERLLPRDGERQRSSTGLFIF